VTVWDAAGGPPRAVLDAHPANIQRLAFSPDGRRLALRDGVKVSLWDVTTAKRRATFQGLVRPAGPLAFAPDGRTLATGEGAGEERTVKLWDVPTD
jgi:WD40 repeat protein